MGTAALAIALLAGLAYAAVVWLQRALMFPGSTATIPSGELERAGGRSVWLEHAAGRTEAWLLPGKPGSAPRSILLYAHGNGELIDHWLGAWEDLRAAGLAILLVEYPGYGRSPGRPSAASVGAVMRAAYDFAVALPGSDPKRVIGYGRSLGGGAVCALANDRALAALVLESTFTSVADIARDRGFPGFLARERFESLAVVERFRGPVLLLHGSRDAMIPVSHAERMHAAAPASELHVSDCGHNDCPPPGPLLRSFLERHQLL